MNSERICHYTTASGIMGILSHDGQNMANLRLSNILQMNDQQEYLNGITMFEELLDTKRKDGLVPKEAFNKMQESFRKFHSVGLHGTDNASDNIYTASFSEEIDDIGQWRGYTKPSDGYCLIFDKDILARSLSADNRRCNLLHCLYASNEKQSWFDWLLSYLMGTPPPFETGFNKDNDLSIGTKARIVLSIMKHEAFSQENEWRIINPSVPIDRVKCVEYGGTIKSFTFISVPTAAIKGIMIGPDVNTAARTDALRIFLKKIGLHNQIEILSSQIPFRNSL